MHKTLLAVAFLAVNCALAAGGSLRAAPADKPTPKPGPSGTPAASPSPAAAASPIPTPKPAKTPKPPKPSKDPAPAKPGALETDPTGWTDLLPDPDLHGWKRVAYADKPLDPKVSNPWSRIGGTDLLHCAKTPSVEMFLNEQTFGDGVFHVEWHFVKAKGKDKDFNSGVFVRTLADGKVWHQAQAGGVKNIGYLFGNTLKGGKIVPFRADDKLPLRGNAPDEWNTYEITCKGKEITLWINGAVTATWTDCEVPRGMIGLEAEGSEVEFRNLKFKELK